MKGEWVAAERVEEIRAAADGWKGAGALETGSFEEISRRYPEPRPIPAPLWRALVFFFVALGILLILGAFALGARPNIGGFGVLLSFFGVACVAATEVQENLPALALRGGAGATALLGIAFLLGALFILLEETLHLHEPEGPNVFLLATLAVCALAAWRWGSPAWALFAAVSLFLLLGRAPFGRALWIVFGIAMALVFERFLDRPSWAPSHRKCAAVLVLVALLAVYGAVNLYALDHRAVEVLRSAPPDFPGPGFRSRVVSIVGTSILPLAVLWWGIRSRRTLVLDAGLVLLAVSLATLRFYVHVAPLWVILLAAGGTLVLLALGLNRWLARGAKKERDGFTAEPLFADETRLRALELVSVVAAHAPEARPAVEPGFQGGGGSFGGGGAGGSF